MKIIIPKQVRVPTPVEKHCLEALPPWRWKYYVPPKQCRTTRYKTYTSWQLENKNSYKLFLMTSYSRIRKNNITDNSNTAFYILRNVLEFNTRVELLTPKRHD